MKYKLLIFSLFLFLISPFALAQTLKEYRERIKEEKQYLLDSYKSELQDQKEKFLARKELLKQTRAENKEEFKEEKRDEICAKLEEKIDAKVDKFDKTREVHVTKYTRLHARLTEIMNTMKDEDLDVDEFKDDLDVLKEMIKDYDEAYADFIESLRFVRGYACGKTDGDFKENLQEAKDYFAVVKKIRAEIREFYTGVLRNHIKDLRDQYKDKIAEDDEDKDDEEDEDVDQDGTGDSKAKPNKNKINKNNESEED